MDFGLLRVAAAIPGLKVADCRYNAEQIEKMIVEAAQYEAAVVVFPELSLTGYTCGDLFAQQMLPDEAEMALGRLVAETAALPQVVVVGMPFVYRNGLYNVAVVFARGQIQGIVPKTYLPNHDEFYENRWFASGAGIDTEVDLCGQKVPFSTRLLFGGGDKWLGVEICEDLWTPVPPSSLASLAGANLIVNLSASNELAGKHNYLRTLIQQQSARTISAYVYASAGFGESSTDLVFTGNGFIAENGEMLAEASRFSIEEQLIFSEIDLERLSSTRRRINTYAGVEGLPEYRRVQMEFLSCEIGDPTFRTIHPCPFIPDDKTLLREQCEEVLCLQTAGLAQRLRHTAARTAVVGISGGLDSTLALLVVVRAFDKLGLPRKQILGVTMPGFGTTGRTYNNALTLMQALGIEIREISIREACEQHFRDIGLDPSDRGAAYENAQARERTQILMDLANMTGGLVVGTGDLSELALGWATYNGDQMSMYGVNAGVPKTLVRHLVNYVAETSSDERVKGCLLDILDTPISPELLPASGDGQIAQKTEDLVGPYELHDFFLYYFLRYGFRPSKLFFMACKAFAGVYDGETVKKWLVVFLQRFFSQQFKRSAMPDGPKVLAVGLSPRGDWRMPSDAVAEMWIAEAESL